ncbi:MAG: hypothetical protein O3A00_07085 [Planctomycetota bacterium]|nr:hypothetical protein [Planctomycetota bacterium]
MICDFRRPGLFFSGDSSFTSQIKDHQSSIAISAERHNRRANMNFVCRQFLIGSGSAGLGNGLRLSPDLIHDVALKLVETESFDSGLVKLRYAAAGEAE